MPSNIPATTILIEPGVKALVRDGGMPFEMKVETPTAARKTVR